MESDQQLIDTDICSSTVHFKETTQEKQQKSKKAFHDEREKLINQVRIYLMHAEAGGASDVDVHKVPDLSIRQNLTMNLGFDPFPWLCFEEYNYNVQFANRASSDPHLFNALMKAGDIFEKTQSSYLHRKFRHFHEEVTSATDVDKTTNAIVTFCN